MEKFKSLLILTAVENVRKQKLFLFYSVKSYNHIGRPIPYKPVILFESLLKGRQCIKYTSIIPAAKAFSLIKNENAIKI